MLRECFRFFCFFFFPKLLPQLNLLDQSIFIWKVIAIEGFDMFHFVVNITKITWDEVHTLDCIFSFFLKTIVKLLYKTIQERNEYSASVILLCIFVFNIVSQILSRYCSWNGNSCVC